MRSCYIIMIGFIAIIAAMILLIGSFNDIVGYMFGSPYSLEMSSCSRQSPDTAKPLPWQLDAISIDTSSDAEKEEIHVYYNIPSVSSLGNSRTLLHHVMREYLKAQG